MCRDVHGALDHVVWGQEGGQTPPRARELEKAGGET